MTGKSASCGVPWRTDAFHEFALQIQREIDMPSYRRPAIVLVALTLLGSFALGPIALGQDKKPAASSDSAAPLITTGRIELNLAGAELILKAAREKAAAMGVKVNIAVVDDGGHLLAFNRMDGARPASGYTALTKATSAATFRQESGSLPAGAEPNLLLSLGVPIAAAASGGTITTLKGGVPILVEGQVIGAVGVGGASGEQDAEVAKAGIQGLVAAFPTNAPTKK